MDPDDVAYRRSVRNTSLILAAIVITIFAALFIPSAFVSPNRAFSKSGTALSENGLSLNARLDATEVPWTGAIGVAVWLNSTSPQILNVSISDRWALDRNSIWVSPCFSANSWWPFGIAVMKGFYTTENYSSGSQVLGPEPLVGCLSVSNSTGGSFSGQARYFLFQAHSSKAIVPLTKGIEFWPMTTYFYFAVNSLNVGDDFVGAYTLIALDEWGDMIILHFSVG